MTTASKEQSNKQLISGERLCRLLKFSGFKSMPLVLQTEATECGLACIAMVAGYHGFKSDLNWLRSHFQVSLKGASLSELIATCGELNLSTRALKLDIDDLKHLKLPCILHWDLNHFVVLRKVNKTSVCIYDPACGKREMSLSDFGKHFTGIALEATPNSSFKKQKQQTPLSLSMFYKNISGLMPSLIKVFLLSILLQVFALASPYYMQLVVDEVLLSVDLNLLYVLAFGFAMLAVIELATRALRSTLILYFSNILNIQITFGTVITPLVVHHLLRLPLDFFEKRHIGDVLSRFGSLTKVKEILTTGIVEAIVDGLMALATLVMIFLYSAQLGAVVCIAVLLYVVVRILLYMPLKQLSEEAILAGAKEQSHFIESVKGIMSIKLFARENYRQNTWQNAQADFINCGIRLGKLQIHFRWLNDAIFAIENVLIIFLAAKLIIDNQLSVGMLFAFVSYKKQFIDKMVNLTEKLVEFKMLQLHLGRIADIALHKQEKNLYSDSAHKQPLTESSAYKETADKNLDLSSNHNTAKAPVHNKAILELKGLSFRYHKNEPLIFDNLDLSVLEGESIAIIGPSGCGKSTLMKLMLGLFQPLTGKVQFKNDDINNIGLSSYRQQTGAVMQDDQLLSGTISDNVSFFSEHIEQSKLNQACQLAAIDKDIANMPMGFNTFIGDMGSILSGGQKQRVLLARALYKQPSILYLDEATSHLDPHIEQQVNAAIKNLSITRMHNGQLVDVTKKIKSQVPTINND